jgi:hypothetical protein
VSAARRAALDASSGVLRTAREAGEIPLKLATVEAARTAAREAAATVLRESGRYDGEDEISVEAEAVADSAVRMYYAAAATRERRPRPKKPREPQKPRPVSSSKPTVVGKLKNPLGAGRNQDDDIRNEISGAPPSAVLSDTPPPIRYSTQPPQCRHYAKTTHRRCMRGAMENGYCYFHGGADFSVIAADDREHDGKIKVTHSGGIAMDNAPRPGEKESIYYKYLTPEEQLIYANIKIGSLEDEIRIVKIQLRRAIEKQKLFERIRELMNETVETEDGIRTPEEVAQLLEISEYSREITDGVDGRGASILSDVRKVMRRKTDYLGEIKKLTKLLSELEMTHVSLTATSPLQREEAVRQLATQLRAFSDAAAGLFPGGSAPPGASSEPISAEEAEDEGRGAEGRGAEGRGAEGRGAEGRGADGRGADGRGADGRGADD